MKNIITVLFCMLFVTSAYSLDFDSNTGSCLRDILDKPEGEITVEDLQEIDEFYCYSDVSPESFEILAENLKDNTKIFLGNEEEGSLEGLIINGEFLAGYFLDNNKFVPGILDKDIFIPGIWDLKGKQFLHGLLFDDGFVMGIIKDGVFNPGSFIDGKFVKGIVNVDTNRISQFNKGDFSKDFLNVSGVLSGNHALNMGIDALRGIGSVSTKHGFVGQDSLMISGRTMKSATNFGADILAVTGTIGGIVTAIGTATATPAGVATIAVAGVGLSTVGGLIVLAGLTTAVIMGGVIIAHDAVTGKETVINDDSIPNLIFGEDEPKSGDNGDNGDNKDQKNANDDNENDDEDKRKEEDNGNMDEILDDWNDDESEEGEDEKKKGDTGCESPYGENDTGSGGEGEGEDLENEKGNIDYGYDGEGKTSGTGTGTGVKPVKGDIDWGEEGNPNNKLGGEENPKDVETDPGNIDWGYNGGLKPIKPIINTFNKFDKIKLPMQLK